MKKCFEGIATLNFTETLDVNTMRSSEGEEIELVEVISTAKAKGQVEKWLFELESIMKRSVHRKVKESLENYPDVPRHEWVLKWPGQCVRYILKQFIASYHSINITFLELGAKHILNILDI